MQEKKYYSENILSTTNNSGTIDKSIIIHRKKPYILIPNSTTRQKSNILLTKEIPSKNIRKRILNKKVQEKSRNNNIALEEKILLKRPQIKIKMQSLKHNNKNRNTISSEKNNSQLKCKVHEIKPQTTKNKNIHNQGRN